MPLLISSVLPFKTEKAGCAVLLMGNLCNRQLGGFGLSGSESLCVDWHRKCRRGALPIRRIINRHVQGRRNRSGRLAVDHAEAICSNAAENPTVYFLDEFRFSTLLAGIHSSEQAY